MKIVREKYMCVFVMSRKHVLAEVRYRNTVLHDT